MCPERTQSLTQVNKTVEKFVHKQLSLLLNSSQICSQTTQSLAQMTNNSMKLCTNNSAFYSTNRSRICSQTTQSLAQMTNNSMKLLTNHSVSCSIYKQLNEIAHKQLSLLLNEQINYQFNVLLICMYQWVFGNLSKHAIFNKDKQHFIENLGNM